VVGERDNTNIFEKKLEEQAPTTIRTLHSSDLLPDIIKQRNIAEGHIIFRGLLSDRPTDGGTQIQVYYGEDTSNLYIWNTVNKTWETV